MTIRLLRADTCDNYAECVERIGNVYERFGMSLNLFMALQRTRGIELFSHYGSLGRASSRAQGFELGDCHEHHE